MSQLEETLGTNRAVIGRSNGEMMAPTSCDDRCSLHPEFSRRLDERWKEHLDQHANSREELCGKLTRMQERLERLDRKISWMAGAIAVGMPLMQLLFHTILKGKIP